MKPGIRLTSCLFAVLPLTAALADGPADELLGQWYTEDDDSKVLVVKKNGKYYGRIIWLDEPLYHKDHVEAGKPKHDRKNRDKSLQWRPIIGLQVLKDFKYDAGDRLWDSGTIYDPDVGKTYKCEIKFKTDPEAEGGKSLNLKGYIGIPTFGRTTVWRRVPKDDLEETD